MTKVYVTIANKQYYTTKDVINFLAVSCGFDRVVYVPQNIKGKYREGYYSATFKGNFNSFAQKLKCSQKVREELKKIEVV